MFFSDRASWINYTLITNLMHWLLFIHKMLLRNEEVLLRVNEQRNILHEIRKRKANCFGHILRRNCLLKQVIEGKLKGKMEVARRRGRRRKKLLDDLKDRRGYSHLKEEALDRTMWRYRFGGGFGPVVRQNTEWMNEWKYCELRPLVQRYQISEYQQMCYRPYRMRGIMLDLINFLLILGQP